MSELILAIPSKGRLKKDTEAVFDRAGFTITADGGERSYSGGLMGFADGNSCHVVFLSASEIAREIMRGTVHLGVTGEDLVRETLRHVEERISLEQKLGFGHANVVVAVPDCWCDVRTMADLDDVAADYRKAYGRRLRVATKYWMLTQSFFARHGLGTYRIVESLGATEGAPAAGTADAIVDITSTGATLDANHLRILDDGVILRSEANLIASKSVEWTANATAKRDELIARLKLSL